MDTIKPIHLRDDEFNRYIEEYKQQVVYKEGELNEEEKYVVYRCGVDYGLEVDNTVTLQTHEVAKKEYNIILRINGPFTLPEKAHFSSEHGVIKIHPYIIQEHVAAKRYKAIANSLFAKKLVTSPVSIDEEYIYEALRESAFTVAMEEVVTLGERFQIIQINFDEDGHFKALELDESHY